MQVKFDDTPEGHEEWTSWKPGGTVFQAGEQ